MGTEFCSDRYELFTKVVPSQGNRAMQRVFPTPNYSLIVMWFSSRKIKAVIAPAYIYIYI